MDNATVAVLLTFGGTFLTAISGIAIAVIYSNRERVSSAESAADSLNEQWRKFKDDKIQSLREDNADLRRKWADAEARADREHDRSEHLQMVIDEQRAEEQEKIRDRQ